MSKSPFYIVREFVSPKACENIVNQVKPIEYEATDRTQFPEDLPSKVESHDEQMEQFIYNQIRPLIPKLEAHYGMKIKGMERAIFQFFPECRKSGPADDIHCENANYIRKKWVRTRNRDLTAILWLKDHQSEPPIDLRSEVFGGRLEFPMYDFSLNPEIGTLVIYPAGPHFISAVSQVLAGKLYQVRLNFQAEEIWSYQPEAFGIKSDEEFDYIKEWF